MKRAARISSSRTALPFSEHGKEAVNSWFKLANIGNDSLSAIDLRRCAPAQSLNFDYT